MVQVVVEVQVAMEAVQDPQEKIAEAVVTGTNKGKLNQLRILDLFLNLIHFK